MDGVQYFVSMTPSELVQIKIAGTIVVLEDTGNIAEGPGTAIEHLGHGHAIAAARGVAGAPSRAACLAAMRASRFSTPNLGSFFVVLAEATMREHAVLHVVRGQSAPASFLVANWLQSPRQIPCGAFSVPSWREVENRLEARVVIQDVADPNHPIRRSILLVFITAKETPVPVWASYQEHRPLAMEHVGANISFLMERDSLDHGVSLYHGPPHSSGVNAGGMERSGLIRLDK